MEFEIDKGSIRVINIVTTTPLIAGNQANGQVALPAAATTPIVAALATTLSIVIINDGANPCWIGLHNAITNVDGFYLPRFGVIEIIGWQGGVWGYAAAAAASNVGFIELRV